MYVDASVFAPLARNPDKSKVYDKLGYAMHPKGKVISTEMGGFAIGIPANAKNPKEAFLFMAWLTSKDTAKKIMLNGGAPFRISTLKDPELQAKYPEYKVLAETIPYINPDWRPIIPQFNEIENIFGIAVNQVLTGQKTPEEAMQGIMQPERDLMVKYGYIK
jgi:multiple sugar transport system substrate-binding protein